MADHYEIAVQRRDKLRAFVEKMEKRIENVRPELDELDTYCRVHERMGGIEKEELPVKPKLVTRHRKKPKYGDKVKRMRENAHQMIAKHGPLTSRGVLEKLDELGIGQDLITGDDLRKRLSYMSSVMSRDKNLEQDREAGGYVLKRK